MEDIPPLKLSKFRLNGGHARDALTLARGELNNVSGRLAAVALDRTAQAYAALGQTEAALSAYEDAERAFRELRQPDTIGLAITVRNQELFRARHCQKSSSEWNHFMADRKARIEELVLELENLVHGTRWSANPRRIELELAVTRSFLTRIDILTNPLSRLLQHHLELDWREIAYLRGYTKPMYELDALEWVVHYCELPVVPDSHTTRGLLLSIQVRNIGKMTRFALTPGITLTSHLSRRTVQRFFG